MTRFIKLTRIFCTLCAVAAGIRELHAADAEPFKVIAFYTGKNDLAHISFVKEANRWFPQAAARNHFRYEATSNWNELNDETLARYQVVLFLDTRPEAAEQRAAFQKYMEHGARGWDFILRRSR